MARKGNAGWKGHGESIIFSVMYTGCLLRHRSLNLAWSKRWTKTQSNQLFRGKLSWSSNDHLLLPPTFFVNSAFSNETLLDIASEFTSSSKRFEKDGPQRDVAPDTLLGEPCQAFHDGLTQFESCKIHVFKVFHPKHDGSLLWSNIASVVVGCISGSIFALVLSYLLITANFPSTAAV